MLELTLCLLVVQNATSVTQEKHLEISKIVLEVPWIIANDLPLERGNPTSFLADIAGRACSELLQGYKFRNLHWTSPTCKVVEIVAPPEHGRFEMEGNGIYRYTPAHGFLGKDQIQYVVEGTNGRRVFVTMQILLQTAAEAYSSNGFEQSNVFGNSASFATDAPPDVGTSYESCQLSADRTAGRVKAIARVGANSEAYSHV